VWAQLSERVHFLFAPMPTLRPMGKRTSRGSLIVLAALVIAVVCPLEGFISVGRTTGPRSAYGSAPSTVLAQQRASVPESPDTATSQSSLFSLTALVAVTTFSFVNMKLRRRQQVVQPALEAKPIESLEPQAGGMSALFPAQHSFAGSAVPVLLQPRESSAVAPPKTTMNLLMPKNVRWRKPHRPAVKPFHSCTKWKFRGFAERGNKPHFGKYALQALEEAWISSKQIESVRRAIVRTMERKGKIWIRVFPHQGITQRVADTRMGAGKGAISYWVSAVRPHAILFEVDGISEDIARNAFRKASYRLPCKVRFLMKEDGPSRFEQGLAGKTSRGGDAREKYERAMREKGLLPKAMKK